MTRVIILALALSLVAAPWAAAGDRPAPQVVVEAGLSHPYGELGASPETTRLGQGAYDGLEIGFGLRIPLSRTVTIGPSFMFVDYGNFVGSTPEVDEYKIESSSYRYTLEAQVTSPEGSSPVRPFLAAGVGYYRNRMFGFYQSLEESMDESVHSLGFSFRAGFRRGGLELSAGYHFNRFQTWHFHRSDYRERYNWDSLGLRASWLVPLGG